MGALKCKMCGGDLEIIEGKNIAACEYCGTRQTVPNIDDEKKRKLYERANKLRFNCFFDKAASAFENIVNEFPDDAEAYWGLVLCNYGIEYVDDPVTGKKVPTCHRSSFESLLDDPDFEMVMENSESEARILYREEAKQIEEIRKGIIEVSGKEEPYDIFICYKETDDDGERTLDSVLAQDVYEALTTKGYRVFFSRISLEDKLGTEYEPYIFAALNSAKIMLVFGTSYNYFNAVWVKNEWARFLKLMASNKEKYLIPCYKDIDAYDMPEEFKRLQAQDMGKIGAIQDLLRGIEKLIGSKEQTRDAYIKELERKIASLQSNRNDSSRSAENNALQKTVGQQDGLAKKADSASVEEYIRNNFNSNTMVKAIKYYRDMTGAGLAEGKAAVDKIFEEKKKEDLANSDFSPVPLTMQGIVECLDNHDQTGAVKLIMKNYNMDQKEAERYCRLFFLALNVEHYPMPEDKKYVRDDDKAGDREVAEYIRKNHISIHSVVNYYRENTGSDFFKACDAVRDIFKSMNGDEDFNNMKECVFELDEAEKKCLETYEKEKDSRPDYCAERMEHYRGRVKHYLERIDYHDKRIRKEYGLEEERQPIVQNLDNKDEEQLKKEQQR